MPLADAQAPPRVARPTQGLLPLLLAAAAGGVKDRAAREPPPAGAEGLDAQCPKRAAQAGYDRGAIPPAELCV
eukprot:4661073-Alexandrium_andersonii.AAC.1